MAVPYFRLGLEEAEIDAVVGVLRSGWLTTGAQCQAFEKEFAAALGGDLHAIAVNSNTSGMHLALEAAGIGPGDEVIVPTLTFTATAEVVRYLGAEAVLVDVLPDTLCIDPQKVEAAITERTKAIMPVHFGGLGVDMDALKRIAGSNGLVIIEDAAHSFPAKLGGKPIGQLGSAAAVFSFYANKTITTGEGGMIVTADEEIARRCQVMRLHGIDRDAFKRFQGDSSAWAYDIVAPGFKYNLPDMAAALGRQQLARAEAMRSRRQDIADRYRSGLSGLPLQLPVDAAPGGLHAWHLYPVQVMGGAVDRPGLERALTAAGIGYSVHYTPLHRMKYWQERYGLDDRDFPVASSYFERALSLPLFSDMTVAEADEVISIVRAAVSPGA